MYMAKGQGMPLNVIVIAAIVLVVMVVLLFIYTQESREYNREVERVICETQQGFSCCPSGSLSAVAKPQSGWVDCPEECCTQNAVDATVRGEGKNSYMRVDIE